MQDNTPALQCLLLYRHLLEDNIIQDFISLRQQLPNKADQLSLESLFSELCYRLFRSSQAHNASGNIWQNYILNLILGDENIFSLSCEKRGRNISPSLYQLAIHDLQIIKRLYFFDWAGLGQELGVEY